VSVAGPSKEEVLYTVQKTSPMSYCLTTQAGVLESLLCVLSTYIPDPATWEPLLSGTAVI
jgi:hypothetical protein